MGNVSKHRAMLVKIFLYGSYFKKKKKISKKDFFFFLTAKSCQKILLLTAILWSINTTLLVLAKVGNIVAKILIWILRFYNSTYPK